jgi:hypothetical protein
MKKFITYIVIILTCSCNQNKCNNNIESLSLEVSKIENTPDFSNVSDLICLLNKSIDSLPTIGNYTQSKVCIEDDESFVNWWSINYYYENTLIFAAESNWENKNIVSRITLYSSIIKENNVYVGQTIGNVKNLINNNIPVSPDGELFVILKKHKEINLKIDISKFSYNSPLYYGGITDITEIPDTLKIELIVIMNR